MTIYLPRDKACTEFHRNCVPFLCTYCSPDWKVEVRLLDCNWMILSVLIHRCNIEDILLLLDKYCCMEFEIFEFSRYEHKTFRLLRPLELLDLFDQHQHRRTLSIPSTLAVHDIIHRLIDFEILLLHWENHVFVKKNRDITVCIRFSNNYNSWATWNIELKSGTSVKQSRPFTRDDFQKSSSPTWDFMGFWIFWKSVIVLTVIKFKLSS